MLINMTVENWLSFRSTTLSMVATRASHGERIPSNKFKWIAIAALCSGNASGKTTSSRPWFVQRLVVDGTHPDRAIPVHPFRLDDSPERPTRFSLTMLIDEIIYELSFAVTARSVLEEKLVRITSASDRVLYHRTSPEGQEITFHDSLRDQDILRFAARGTRDNQLFLTNAVSQKISIFSPTPLVQGLIAPYLARFSIWPI